MRIHQAYEQNNRAVKIDGGAIDIMTKESALLEWEYVSLQMPMQWYYKEKAKCRKNKASMILCFYKQKCKTLFKCKAAVIVSKEKKASFNTERACPAILESLPWM